MKINEDYVFQVLRTDKDFSVWKNRKGDILYETFLTGKVEALPYKSSHRSNEKNFDAAITYLERHEWADRLDPNLIRSQILWHSLGVTDVKDEHAYIQDNINEARRKVVMAKLYKKDTV